MNQTSTVQRSYSTILKRANLINNVSEPDGAGKTTVSDKYSGSIIATIPEASEAQLEAAITGSVAAFKTIKTWSAEQRAAMLGELVSLLESKQEAFADLIVAEAGKPIDYATNEIDRCLSTLRIAQREALRLTGETVPIDFQAGKGKTALTQRFPIGPIAAISPFNFPLNLALHKIAPALACGCSIVLKPSPLAPLTTLAFADLVVEAGYPAGTLNVVNCAIDVAEKLVRDERMAMLSFTGSPAVGWHLKNIAGRKKIALELGGNAPVIVDEGIPIEATAKAIAAGSFLFAGQICISTQRIYVHASLYNAFETALINATKELTIGDPSLKGVLVGPIINTTHLQRVHAWVNDAVQAGATLLTGGEILDQARNLYAPTLLSNTTVELDIVRKEVFGPVAVLEKVESFDEAIQKANATIYGLQAGVFTNRIDHMKKAFQQLETGGVIINNVPGFRLDNMPYGGVKQSGLGREGVRYAMDEMTEVRLLVF
jgi:acyl-CoA reductase-like NAD-dependent aldehyde dehydrogenase